MSVPNFSRLACLKVPGGVVGWGVVWLSSILVFSLSLGQAEQLSQGKFWTGQFKLRQAKSILNRSNIVWTSQVKLGQIE